MGHMGTSGDKRRMRTGDEYDAYCRNWRQMYVYLSRPGVVRKIKRRTHKRERREGRAEARYGTGTGG